MSNSNEKINGLAVHSIDKAATALIDPDNVFWAITAKEAQGAPFVSREVLSLYQKQKDSLDEEMKQFRFSAELSAVYIDPTDRCNSNCPYCYVPAKMRKNGAQMTTGQLRQVLNKVLDYFSGKERKPVIIFHASEPLLAKEAVFSAIREFKDKFSFGLQTNGLLLEKEDVEFLKEYRVGVGISLDAPLRSLNNKTRPSAKGGNFDAVVRAIDWFDGYAGLNVISTMTKFNIHSLDKLVRFLHSKKVPCVLFNPVRLTQKHSLKTKPDEKLMTKNFLKAVDSAIELSRSSGRGIIVANFSNVILSIVAPEARRMMCDISPCGGGRCFLTVTASGEMIPCGEFIGLKNSSGGNIFKTGIREAMESAPFQKIRSRFVEKIAECDVCLYRNICGAPCPAELGAMGNSFQKAVFCEFYKAIIDHAFKLIAEGNEKYCFREEGWDNLVYNYQLK
ncbi:MAG: peptide-modifying radical SAM enzyme CbpB [Candidatus Omnitrophota bacterium]